MKLATKDDIFDFVKKVYFWWEKLININKQFTLDKIRHVDVTKTRWSTEKSLSTKGLIEIFDE